MSTKQAQIMLSLALCILMSFSVVRADSLIASLNVIDVFGDDVCGGGGVGFTATFTFDRNDATSISYDPTTGEVTSVHVPADKYSMFAAVGSCGPFGGTPFVGPNDLVASLTLTSPLYGFRQAHDYTSGDDFFHIGGSFWRVDDGGETGGIIGGSFSLRYSSDDDPPPPPKKPGLLLDVEDSDIWANGIESTIATVSVSDEVGAPVAGALVELLAEPFVDVFINPQSTTTDASGEARFMVSSTLVHETSLFVVHPLDDSVVRRSNLNFVERKIVVFAQGIKTSLTQDGLATDGDEVFPAIRSALRAKGFVRPARGIPELGRDCHDGLDSDSDGRVDDGCPLIMNFSYRGIRQGPSSSTWRSLRYECKDTARNLRQSAIRLYKGLSIVSEDSPNTAFAIVGHSQGGFVAFLSMLSMIPPEAEQGTLVELKEVITLDSPLGGTPWFETGVPAAGWFGCWGNPAARQLSKVYHSATDRNEQGTTANFVPSRTSNFSIVAQAKAAGIRILTLGTFDDCVYQPAACGLPGFFNISSQIIKNADNNLFILGKSCVGGTVFWGTGECVALSHSAVLKDPVVVTTILDYIGKPYRREGDVWR